MEKLKQVLNSPLSRRKSVQSQSKTFGTSLEVLASSSQNSSSIPFILERVCRFICSNGIECEGIFRINGSAKTVEKIKETFDKTGDAELETVDDIMAVAGTLKQFLRELPDSVIPLAMTAQFVEVQEECRQDKKECLKRLKRLLAELPSINFQVLKYISRFLVEVAKKESLNKMSMTALGIVFGPNLFRCSAGIEGLKDQGVTNEIVFKFISDYEQLFGSLDEPASFMSIESSSQESQPPKYRGAAPARPPPPRFAAADGVPYPSPRSRNGESVDDLQQRSPSPRLRASDDDLMERASPFTLADSDGTSTVASPILTAVASEAVAKAISSTISELLFCPIKSSAGSSDKTAGSSPAQARNDSSSETVDRVPAAKPLRRLLHQNAVQSVDGHGDSVRHDSMDVDSRSQESEEIRYTPKARVSRKNKASTNPSTSSVHTDSLDSSATSSLADEVTAATYDLDVIARQDSLLSAVKKPMGPKNRRLPASHKTIDTPVRAVGAGVLTEENNNDRASLNKHTFSDLPSGAASLGNSKLGDIVAASASSGSPSLPPDIPPLDLRSLKESTTRSSVHISLSTASLPAHLQDQNSILEGTADLGGAVSPAGHQHNHEQSDTSKLMHRKIRDLEATVAEFEASYEAEHGCKPSYQDKATRPDIKKAMSELARVRKEAKGLEAQLQGGLSGSMESLNSAHGSPSSAGSHDNAMLDRTLPPEGAVSNGRSKKPLAADRSVGQLASDSQPATKEPASMKQTLSLLLHRLRDKRKEAGRPEDVGQMTREQIQDEKLCVQKALLHFEGQHGRPMSKSEKELMKPLYNRYRQIKKIITSASLGKIGMAGDSMDAADFAGSTNVTLMIPNRKASDRTLAPPDSTLNAEKLMRSKENMSLNSMSSQELLREQSKTMAEKKRLHRILRTFEDNFAREHGRAVQKEDRAHMVSEYREYKYIKSKIRLLESLLAKHDPAETVDNAS